MLTIYVSGIGFLCDLSLDKTSNQNLRNLCQCGRHTDGQDPSVWIFKYKKKHTVYSSSIVTIRTHLLRRGNILMFVCLLVFIFMASSDKTFSKIVWIPQSLINKGIEKLKLLRNK